MTPDQLMQERARLLARTPEQARGNQQTVLLVQVSDEQFALPLDQLQGVRVLSHLTPLPGSGTAFAGLTSLHGHIISVLDLGALLNLTPESSSQCVVLHQHGVQQVALRVGQVLEVLQIPLELSEPPFPRVGVQGTYRARISLLDLDLLLEHHLQHKGANL